MTTLNINFVNDATTPRFPVYCQYGGQHQPQSAYIYLDLRDGECGADYSSEIGNAVSIAQWNDIFLTFPISAETMADQIENMLNEHAEDFQAILDDSEIVWNGNNNVGRFGEKATAILSKLGFYADGNPNGIQDCDSRTTMIDEAYFADWIGDELLNTNGRTIEEFARHLLSCDGECDSYFSDELNDIDAIVNQLRYLWAEHLYAGHDLPQDIAQYLLDSGECDDSAWLDELNEFAASKA